MAENQENPFSLPEPKDMGVGWARRTTGPKYRFKRSILLAGHELFWQALNLKPGFQSAASEPVAGDLEGIGYF